MTSIESVTLESPDPAAANRFYANAFGLGIPVRLRASQAPTTGFRGFTMSLVVSQPATASGFIGAALDVGATPRKLAANSFWGYGGVVQAPDGTIWKVATSGKNDSGRPHGRSIRSCSCSASQTSPRASDSTLTGSHRIVIGSDAGTFTDPDGFAWQAA